MPSLANLPRVPASFFIHLIVANQVPPQVCFLHVGRCALILYQSSLSQIPTDMNNDTWHSVGHGLRAYRLYLRCAPRQNMDFTVLRDNW